MEKSEIEFASSKEEPPLISRIVKSKENKKDWKDWNWQIKNSLSASENDEKLKNLNLPLRITPYYWDLVQKSPELMLTVVPSLKEILSTGIEDPLCEQEHSPVKNIVHKYPDRVLFLITDFCSVHCRYCTRSRIFDETETKTSFISNKDEYNSNLF